MTVVVKQTASEHFFVTRMKQILTQSDRIALKRAFGLPLSEASGMVLTAFYKVCLPEEEKEEASYLSACAIAYILHYGGSNTPLSQCLKDAEISESRIKSLLSNKLVDREGFFHSKYSRLIRYAVSKGYYPNINEIYPALTEWWKYRNTFIKEFYK